MSEKSGTLAGGVAQVQNSLKNRVFYVDVIRACACVLVVASHVFAAICAQMNNYSAAEWGVFNVLNSIIRPSAALYVMISGKIFLGSSRQESYFHFVWRRYARLCVPFFVWSLIYFIYECHEKRILLSVSQAVLQVLQGPTEYHLWFMYLILGLYLVIPILRRFVQAATPTDLAAALGFWFGFLILQFLSPSYAGSGPATAFVNYGGYLVLGHALDKDNGLYRRSSVWFLFWVIIVLFNAAGTYLLTIQNNGILDERFYFGATPLVALQAGAMFLLLKNVDRGSFVYKLPWLRSTVMRLSAHSYNIYLNHALVILLLTSGHLGFVLSEDTGPNSFVGVALTSSVALACSLGLSLLLQNIPLARTLFVISLPTSTNRNP